MGEPGLVLDDLSLVRLDDMSPVRSDVRATRYIEHTCTAVGDLA